MKKKILLHLTLLLGLKLKGPKGLLRSRFTGVLHQSQIQYAFRAFYPQFGREFQLVC